MTKITAKIVQHQDGKFMCFGEVPGIKGSITGYWHSTQEQAKEGLLLAAQQCFPEPQEFDLYISEVRYWKE